jgi:23S rRNA-/tRNA-specific pseudouridylate synthase
VANDLDNELGETSSQASPRPWALPLPAHGLGDRFSPACGDASGVETTASRERERRLADKAWRLGARAASVVDPGDDTSDVVGPVREQGAEKRPMRLFLSALRGVFAPRPRRGACEPGRLPETPKAFFSSLLSIPSMPAETLLAPPVVACDHRLVVVDKPAGLTSEDAARRLGRRLVHRIDRATSGLLLLADDARTVQRMQRLLSTAQVTRTYLALVRGPAPGGVIDRPLVRNRGDGRRGSVEAAQTQAAVVEVGKPMPAKAARTVVDLVVARAHASLVVARLVTGRTHQVRIHLADTGHPILGDAVYGSDAGTAGVDHDADGAHGAHGAHGATPRLMLHAWQLAFVHPNTHASVRWTAPPPPTFSSVVHDVLGPIPPLPRGPATG